MTLLANLLADPSKLLARAKAKAPAPTRLIKAVNAMAVRDGATEDGENTEGIQRRIAAAVSGGSAGLAALSRRDLREGCRVFFYPPHPPGRTREIGDPLVERVLQLQRRAAYLALIDAYLDGFAVDDLDISNLATALATAAASWPWRPSDLWPERVETFNLFDPADAPQRLAAAVLGADAPCRTLLDQVGLNTDGRRKGGLAEASFKAACDLTARKVGRAATPLQTKVLAWAQDGGATLAFPRAWPEFACALFKPWRGEDPPSAHRNALIEAAVAYGGDPRIGERWKSVKDEDAHEVVVRWLTKASVEQFFDIVSETMTDRPDMWAQRRHFWTQYLKANAISAAWVAFGTDGAERAKRVARTSGDRAFAMFGRLSAGNGRTSQHAALIMRIGDLTVVEWSHNGKCYIWRTSERSAPKLFLRNDANWADYEPRELMYAPLDVTHNSGWQFRIATILRDQSGIRL
jgi:hypothetical protein